MDIGSICENTSIDDESKSLLRLELTLIRNNLMDDFVAVHIFPRWTNGIRIQRAFERVSALGMRVCLSIKKVQHLAHIQLKRKENARYTHQQIKSSSINGQPYFI